MAGCGHKCLSKVDQCLEDLLGPALWPVASGGKKNWASSQEELRSDSEADRWEAQEQVKVKKTLCLRSVLGSLRLDYIYLTSLTSVPTPAGISRPSPRISSSVGSVTFFTPSKELACPMGDECRRHQGRSKEARSLVSFSHQHSSAVCQQHLLK